MKRPYRISGVVQEEETGRPLPGLVVRAYDRDPLFDDDLGFATTDEHGRFEIRFAESAFRDVREQRPDLYLRVYAPDGRREVHQTDGAVRHDASRDEHFHIVISGTRLVPRRESR